MAWNPFGKDEEEAQATQDTRPSIHPAAEALAKMIFVSAHIGGSINNLAQRMDMVTGPTSGEFEWWLDQCEAAADLLKEQLSVIRALYDNPKD